MMKNLTEIVLKDRRLLGLLGLALFSGLAGAAPEGDGIVEQGAGSYSLKRPDTCKELPAKIYKTDGFEGAMPTNQWWSSVVWQPLSQNMFPHPLAVSCKEGGLAVTYTGAEVQGGSGNIMGGGIPAGGDLLVGNSAVEKFTEANCADYSDWFIDVEFEQDKAKLSASFGHGSPYVFFKISGGNPVVRLADRPKLWSGEDGGPVIGLTIGKRHYGLFGASGSSWTGLDGMTLENDSDKGYFSVATLPDAKPATLAMFARYAHNHVVDTRVVPKVGKGTLETAYEFSTEAMEGKEVGTLFALYPHQWKYSKTDLSKLSYGSVRGQMKLGAGKGFSTSVPVQGLLPMLPKEGIPDRERMLGYLKKEAAKKDDSYRDTYWEGKHLGKLATLSGIAEVLGEEELQKRFVDELKERLENWFTASPGEQSPLFYYDSNWGSLIGSKPSYGSDMPLNDHHFHYGYFIRAAAEIARLDPKWAEKWSPMVNLVIRDIASPSKDDKMFPYIRCFDKYAGHSWASGDANFGDGNNQESSSESMNAWYGMMLWGETVGDDLVRDTGLYLYNTERTAVEEYWFDVSGTNFPEEFPHVALGMVWGGKGAFATWFSASIDCIHGINWLPFTPASIYMGRFPNYVEKNYDRIVEKREGGDDFSTGWGDLVVMFGALSDPDPAAAYIDGNPNCKIEEGNSRAFMYHWIHTLDGLGLNDASVTADHPFVNVFIKDGKKTHAAYNFGDKPLTVTFSDGVKLEAAPQGLTLEK